MNDDKEMKKTNDNVSDKELDAGGKCRAACPHSCPKSDKCGSGRFCQLPKGHSGSHECDIGVTW